MTASKRHKNQTETHELSESALSQVSGGIIAVLRQSAQMCDGSVVPSPMAAQNQRGIIAI